MNPWKISAQFAAHTWYRNSHGDTPVARQEATRFARENWVAFLPYAEEGIGRLLIALAKPAKSARRRPRLAVV
jgi:hypothetical protein